MKKQNTSVNIILSAMFLALAYVLPFLTGQIKSIGAMLCPMHIPIILCGFICGASCGAVVGFTAPLLRSLTLGMPALFPSAVSMSFELAVYGFLSGLLYKIFPKKKIFIYLSLLISMIAGRLVWGAAQYICMGLDSSEFTLEAFLAGAVTNAVPGIIIQIVIVPVTVMFLEKHSSNKASF